jgi:uncharacterized membrane protein
MPRWLPAALRGTFVAAYPLLVYVGVSRWSPRTLGLVLLAALLPGLVSKLRTADRAHLWPVLRLPLSIFALVGLGAALDEPRFFYALPVLVNLMLLANFAATLRGPVSMIERFARMQEPELPPGGEAYCRKVTIVWCWFFVANAAACAGLAAAAPVSWWALYTGILAYILVGFGFTLEFLVRKRVFQQFGDSLPDRLLARILRRA